MGVNDAREQAKPAVALLCAIFSGMLLLVAAMSGSGCYATVKEAGVGFLRGPDRKPATDRAAAAAEDRELLARVNCDLAVMSDVLFRYGNVRRSDADDRALAAWKSGAGRCAGDLGPVVNVPQPPVRANLSNQGRQ